MDAANSKIQTLIDAHGVVVFSKSYCHYCKKTKALLSEWHAKFIVYELDKESDGMDIQEALQARTKQSTVPNIFIGKNHIGGYSELQVLDLRKYLDEAGAAVNTTLG